ncbi:MAG: DedA family protein [Devosia sp.]|uniref:YqaA family protein n=1 Tax=Devosia sp. TaxID=1871048 RepID=UPI0024C7EE11|nr:YqaA family protein [Devosia sp.]UYN99347.1 MAG: DedA family protein [Devosia sp.]
MTDTTSQAKPGLYERLKSATGHPLAEPILALICFLEAMIVPVFPEVMLAPMILADRRRAWRLALICTVSSVVGGLFGYAIGYFLFDTIGKGIVEFYGAGAGFEQLRESFAANGAFMIMVGAVTPIPYKIITITSGVAGVDLWTFIFFGLIGRGLRFFVPCGLFYFFGPVAGEFIEKHKKWAGWVMIIAVIGGFAAAPLLFPKQPSPIPDTTIEQSTDAGTPSGS